MSFLLKMVLFQSWAFHSGLILFQHIFVVVHKDTGYWMKIPGVMPVLPALISWVLVVCLLYVALLFTQRISIPLFFPIPIFFVMFPFPCLLVFHNQLPASAAQTIQIFIDLLFPFTHLNQATCCSCCKSIESTEGTHCLLSIPVCRQFMVKRSCNCKRGSALTLITLSQTRVPPGRVPARLQQNPMSMM